MKTNKGNTTLIAVILIAVVAIAGIIYFSMNRGGSANHPVTVTGAAITSAVMARGVDAQGNAVGPTSSFNSKVNKNLYEVLTLQNVTPSTKIAYIRYLNGKYVDSKVATPAAAGITSFYFSFEKGVGGYPPGNYQIVNYIDGKRSVAVSYSFN